MCTAWRREGASPRETAKSRGRAVSATPKPISQAEQDTRSTDWTEEEVDDLKRGYFGF